MEYLSRGFKSVLGNQQAGSQPSAHETVRIHVFVRYLYRVTLSDIDSCRAYSFRLRDCVTVLLPQHFWKTEEMLSGLSSLFQRLVYYRSLVFLSNCFDRMFYRLYMVAEYKQSKVQFSNVTVH